MNTKVIVVGGGVAGMSAAHELRERGFEVEVYEREKKYVGGKARSVEVPDSAENGHLPLPGEHGFRFFPAFYRHIIDTMERIPVKDPKNPRKKKTAADNLVKAEKEIMARAGHNPLVLLNHLPRSLKQLRQLIHSIENADLGFTHSDKEQIVLTLWQILTSCLDRRQNDYERQSWWRFSKAEFQSPAYQNYFADGLTRTLVAAKSKLISAKTGGDILVQLILSMLAFNGKSDRVLNAPTNEAWLFPWRDYLKEIGVNYHHGWEAQSINYTDYYVAAEVNKAEKELNKVVEGISGTPNFPTHEVLGNWVDSVTFIDPDGNKQNVSGDIFIFCVPVESMARMLGFDNDKGMFPKKVPPRNRDLLHAAPTLRDLDALANDTNWMNGIQFYLSEKVPLLDDTRGHVIYSDTKWSLTSISQLQFWPDFDISKHGNGKVKSILSVDISDWYSDGLNGKPARNCTKEEIRDDIWKQLQKSLVVEDEKGEKKSLLKDWDEIGISYYLDRDIVVRTETVAEPIGKIKTTDTGTLLPLERPFKTKNKEPLLVNQLNTWGIRPSATTAVRNMYMAADYVRTFTDLATMEGANEAARRAVNGIIEQLQADHPKNKKYKKLRLARIWNLHEPTIFFVLRWWDRRRFYQGKPWNGKFPILISLIHGISFIVLSALSFIRKILKKLF